MRYQDTGRARAVTFTKVVEKLRTAAGDAAGLSSYATQIKDVINRISDDTDGKRLGRILTLNYLNRVKERQAYVDIIWNERGWAKPVVAVSSDGSYVLLHTYLDPLAQAQARLYLDIIYGKASLPPPPVNRQGDLIRVKENK
jgi:hypothetical protein